MPKTNKEYTIRLVHPELGDWYYHYTSASEYVFTQNINKVRTWKTIKFTEKQIIEISENLKRKKILLVFGNNDDIISREEFKNNLKFSKKGKHYYYKINSVISKKHLKNVQDIVINTSESLLEDSKLITKLIEQNKQTETYFIDIINEMIINVNIFKKSYIYIEKIKNNGSESENVLLDVVDASYGFRLLKLKTLKNKSNE